MCEEMIWVYYLSKLDSSTTSSISEAITEGREAVQELRVSRTSSNDLVEVFRAMGQEVGADLALRQIAKAPLVFRVLVEGKPQLIDPSLRDDI